MDDLVTFSQTTDKENSDVFLHFLFQDLFFENMFVGDKSIFSSFCCKKSVKECDCFLGTYVQTPGPEIN